MTASTVEHAVYLPDVAVTSATPLITPADVPEADEQHLQALRAGETPRPDPNARARYAGVLYRITGWEMFGTEERAYVSELWAEDWDSPEDSVYDEQ